MTCTDDEDQDLQWPGVQQVVRRECERRRLATAHVSHTVTYALTSLPNAIASAARLEQLWRGHWTIENGVHDVRDVTLGEDGQHLYTGHAPQVLAALRNAVLNLVRAAG